MMRMRIEDFSEKSAIIHRYRESRDAGKSACSSFHLQQRHFELRFEGETYRFTVAGLEALWLSSEFEVRSVEEALLLHKPHDELQHGRRPR